MAAPTFHQVLALPAQPQADAFYFVKAGDQILAYLTDNAGVPRLFAGGAIPFVHTQAVAAVQWVVNHNRGYRPAAVTLLSVGGVEIDGAITHVSNNQLLVDLTMPFAGAALVQ